MQVFFKYAGHVGLKGKKKLIDFFWAQPHDGFVLWTMLGLQKKIEHGTTRPIHLVGCAEPAYEP